MRQHKASLSLTVPSYALKKQHKSDCGGSYIFENVKVEPQQYDLLCGCATTPLNPTWVPDHPFLGHSTYTWLQWHRLFYSKSIFLPSKLATFEHH